MELLKGGVHADGRGPPDRRRPRPGAQRDYWNGIGGHGPAAGMTRLAVQRCDPRAMARRVAADLRAGACSRRISSTGHRRQVHGWFGGAGAACWPAMWPGPRRRAPQRGVHRRRRRRCENPLPLAPGAIDAVLSDSTLDHFACEAGSPPRSRTARTLRRGRTLLLTMNGNPLIRLRNLCRALASPRHRALHGRRDRAASAGANARRGWIRGRSQRDDHTRPRRSRGFVPMVGARYAWPARAWLVEPARRRAPRPLADAGIDRPLRRHPPGRAKQGSDDYVGCTPQATET